MKILLLSGTRQVGKDSFQEVFPIKNNGVAFANSLKLELTDISRKMFNKDIFSLTPEEKEIFRPIMIAYGCAWREIDPLHWVKKIERKLNPSLLNIVLDFRFVNEGIYFKEKYPDVKIIHITRDGAPEPTEEEKKNDPLVSEMADYHFHWLTLPNKEDRRKVVEKFLRENNFYSWVSE